MRQLFVAVTLCVVIPSCSDSRFQWAYAENPDGSVLPQEYFRESLADVLYATDAQLHVTGSGNVFTVQKPSSQQTYHIIAFTTESACVTALSAARKQ